MTHENKPYSERDHYHCFDDSRQPEHANHLRCCLCNTEKPSSLADLKQHAMMEEAIASAELATPANDWSGKFDEMIDKAWDKYGEQYEVYSPKAFESEIKSFIQNLLDQHSARLVERIEALKKRHGIVYDNFTPEADLRIYNHALDQAIDIVKDNK
jgi:hypothetical protein